jgi:hypothetical protein
MAIVLDGPVTPDEGTLFVRNIPTPTDGSALDAFLPDVYSQSTEFDFTVLNKTGNTARFRAWDAPAHMNPRDSMVINRVPLVPLSATRPVISEQELAKLYGLAYLNDPKAATARAIYDDMDPLAKDVRRRAQQMKGQILSTGTAVINEGGLNGTVDFGVPGGNKLTAPTLWSTITADIITFLNTARAAYIALNGFPPGKWLSSTNVLSLMQQNTNLQKMAVQSLSSGQLGGYQGLIPQSALQAILGAFNLPDPTVNICDARVSVDGTSTLLLPANVVVLGPPSDQEMGRFQWGPTVTGQKLVSEGAISVGEAPGLIGFVDRADEFPYKERSIVDSVGFGGVTNPNAHMILTVA